MSEVATADPRLSTPPSSHWAAAKSVGRRLFIDWMARWMFTIGGVAIILSIFAILFVIIFGVIPLFRTPTVTLLASFPSPEPLEPVAVGTDEYREVSFLLARSGKIRFRSLKNGSELSSMTLKGMENQEVTSVAAFDRNRYVAGTSNGTVLPFTVSYPISFADNVRRISAELEESDPIVLDPETHGAIRKLAYAVGKKGRVLVGLVGDRGLLLYAEEKDESLIGNGETQVIRTLLPPATDDRITSMALNSKGQDLFVGTSGGDVIRYNLKNPRDPKTGGVVSASASPGTPITTMGFLLGDQTLVIGDEKGSVSSWHVVTEPGTDDRRLVQIYNFSGHSHPVTLFDFSVRNKGFITADSQGLIRLHFGTSGETLQSYQVPVGSVRALYFSSKSDGMVAADDRGTLLHMAVHNPHPEVSWKTLFGKVRYEGYSTAEYVWQSTGGTDDFEPKLTLTPLIYGTLKGTLYAMLFAIPLSLLSALYTSQFLHQDLRGRVKPVIEFMAALPSVVLGFIAGLWLAPTLETILPGILVMPFVMSALILLAMAAYKKAGIRAKVWFRKGAEIYLLLPVVLASVWVSLHLGFWLEEVLMGNDLRGWIKQALGLTFDQRNSVVVGIAMGFAVIPIIYTIAEDSLSSVPPHLAAGSLALGASPWQTAIRVVLPTASPGIFSAVMIGLGRAVGETMIVLMATGNTPLMDLSPFNGFRALSANIAVELPEAPAEGTLFRVLFLAALLLFVMTFIVNTAAEAVRLKLRRKYRFL